MEIDFQNTLELYITTIGPERRCDLQDKLSIKSASQAPLWCPILPGLRMAGDMGTQVVSMTESLKVEEAKTREEDSEWFYRMTWRITWYIYSKSSQIISCDVMNL